MRNNSICEGKPRKCSFGLLLIAQIQHNSDFFVPCDMDVFVLEGENICVYTLMHLLCVLYGEGSVFSLDCRTNNYLMSY